MTPQIRAATPGDADAVVALHDADDARRELIATLLADPRCRCLVACNGATVVGFVAVRNAHFLGRDFVELLLVDHQRRREGIGSTLIDAVVAAGGTSTIFTSTNVSNSAMQQLLTRDGWLPSGRVTGLDEGDDELFFRVER